MNYEEFLNEIKEKLKSYLENSESDVSVRKILKNNGVELDALTIVDVKCKASPTIYLNKYYKEYLDGRTTEEICDEIYELVYENKDKLTVNISEFSDYSRIRDRIAFKIINAEKNKKLLSRVPHKRKLDLAIVFYCVLKCDYEENVTTLIHNQHQEMWGIGVGTLYEDAMRNAPKLLPYEIKSMNDIIREMLKDSGGDSVCEESVYDGEVTEPLTDLIMEELEKSNDENQMYVLTNKYKLYGASAIFYPDVLKKFAEVMDSNLIIIPSSVHEVILIPMEDDMDMEGFRKMINDVNREEVDPTEILSDHAYIYDRDKDEII